MLTWPHAAGDWADRLDAVYPVFGRIGCSIARYESLLCVCRDGGHAARVRQVLNEHGTDLRQVRFALADSDDSWARDHGALAVLRESGPELLDCGFNGWGGKFPAERDDAINARLSAQGTFGELPMSRHDVVLEGGAIETDGRGTLLATRSSLLTATRNPGLGQAELEDWLQCELGLKRYLWLDHGDISGDDTDGHIDTLARFAAPDTILYATAPAGDRDHRALTAMRDQLSTFRTADGLRYRLVPMPFPGVHRDDAGRRLPASYANFLIINGAVLLPAYGVDADTEARTTLQQVFPGREVVLVDCSEIIRQNGSLHCLTMQFPLGVTLYDGHEVSAA